MSSFTANNTFYKTFTGTDTLAFAVFPETKPILMGSLTTLSYSIFREKKPVPLLGKINTGGYTRGMRTIAGTLVFTLINQHFVKDVVEQVPYLEAHGKLKSDELPFFDIMVICANEYGTSAQMMIYGAEFIDDQQVISISDMYIENVFGFVARDIDTFDNKNHLSGNGNGGVIGGGGSSFPTIQSIDTVMPYDFNLSGYKEFMDNTLLSATSASVYNAQVKLNKLNLLSKTNGVLDNETVEAISTFQKINNIQDTGILDNVTYSLLIDDVDLKDVVTVLNKNGAFVYSNTNKDNIVGILKYKESCLGCKCGDMMEVEFNGNKGYLDIDNTNLKQTYEYDYIDYIESDKRIKVDIATFNPFKIGTNVISSNEGEMKITAISHYKNNVKTLSKYIKINECSETDITLNLIPSSYIYDHEENEIPLYIEFIIYPLGSKPRKWMIDLK